MKRALGHANHMADLGWDVSIVAMDCPENRARIGEECDERVSVGYFHDSGAFAEVASKTRLVGGFAPDWLYLCSYSFRNRVTMRRLAKRPRLIIEHSELSSSIRGLSPMKRLMARHFENRSILLADHIVCASRYLLRHYEESMLRRGLGDKPICCLPYAYPESILRSDDEATDRLRREYGGRTNVVYMGSMISNYGLFVMLEAMVHLREKRNDILLHLIGEGPDLRKAERFARDNGIASQVRFAGYVDERELPSHLRLADAFLAPLFDTVQDWARCPSKTYMYLPFRKPVFTSPIGESAEIFTDPRLFFPCGVSQALAERLAALTPRSAFELPNPLEHSWRQRSVQLSEALLKTHEA